MDRVRPKRSNDTFKITDLVSAAKHGAQILGSPGHSICKLIWKEGDNIKTRQPPALPETICQFHLCSSQLPLPIPWASLLPEKSLQPMYKSNSVPSLDSDLLRAPEREVNLIKGVLSPLTHLLSAPSSRLRKNFHGWENLLVTNLLKRGDKIGKLEDALGFSKGQIPNADIPFHIHRRQCTHACEGDQF